jgi:hypothetical protein
MYIVKYALLLEIDGNIEKLARLGLLDLVSSSTPGVSTCSSLNRF